MDADLLLAFAKRVYQAVEEQGGSADDLQRVLKDDGLVKKIASLIAQSGQAEVESDDSKEHVQEIGQPLIDPASLSTYHLTIDYGKNLQKMIAEGQYDWVNDNITQENFPIRGKGKQEVEAVIVHFGKTMSSEAVLEEFNKMNLDPPDLETLLALGAAYPKLQREFPIVSLNPVWADPDGDRDVACLSRDSWRRDLDLRCFGVGWLLSATAFSLSAGVLPSAWALGHSVPYTSSILGLLVLLSLASSGFSGHTLDLSIPCCSDAVAGGFFSILHDYISKK